MADSYLVPRERRFTEIVPGSVDLRVAHNGLLDGGIEIGRARCIQRGGKLLRERRERQAGNGGERQGAQCALKCERCSFHCNVVFHGHVP